MSIAVRNAIYRAVLNKTIVLYRLNIENIERKLDFFTAKDNTRHTIPYFVKISYLRDSMTVFQILYNEVGSAVNPF